MNYRVVAAAIAVGGVCLGGCSTIIEGRRQDITVNTNPAGASCTLNRLNAEIARVGSTPGTVNVEKTKHDITVICNKDGYQQATYLNHSGADIATVGNIVLGGGVGWDIDSATGSDNKYDTTVNITLLPTGAAPSASTTPSPQGKPSS